MVKTKGMEIRNREGVEWTELVEIYQQSQCLNTYSAVSKGFQIAGQAGFYNVIKAFIEQSSLIFTFDVIRGKSLFVFHNPQPQTMNRKYFVDLKLW